MRIWRWVSPTLSLLGLPGCPGVPPTTGGGTDSAATEGGNDASGSIIPTGGESATGGDQGKVADHRTYFIAETVKFDGDGECQNSKLNAITRRLRTRLDNAGWTGLRFVDENTWPEDFWESSLQPNGVDSLYADAHRLAIYAGHGAPGFLQWGNPSDAGACITLLPERTRLGRLGGDTSAAVMLVPFTQSLHGRILNPMLRGNFSAIITRRISIVASLAVYSSGRRTVSRRKTLGWTRWNRTARWARTRLSS